MAYCTSSEVTDFATFILQDATASARVADGITVAQSKIDGRLQTKFSVPFADPVPELIRTIAVLLAAAWSAKGAYSDSGTQSHNEWAAAREKEAMDLLKEILAGEMRLEDATTLEVVPSQGAPMHVSGVPDYQLRCFDPLGVYGPKMPGSYYSQYWPNSLP